MVPPDQPARRTPTHSPEPLGREISATTLSSSRNTEAPPPPRLLAHEELVLVTAGHGSHEIDFVPYPCRPGTLLRARAGQVTRSGGQAGLDAIVVRWTVDGPADPSAADRPAYWQLVGEDADALINEVSQLVVDSGRPRRSSVVDDLLRHQLQVILLRVALLTDENPQVDPVGDASVRGDTFRRFQIEVERDHARTRRVEEYAERLCCAVRTLTRASLSVTGRTAKQVIDDRVTLQAKRLLAATDLPVAEIGQRLGFGEPTNFGRFFQREAGCSPGTFRATVGEHPPVAELVATTGMMGACRSPRAATMRYGQH